MERERERERERDEGQRETLCLQWSLRKFILEKSKKKKKKP